MVTIENNCDCHRILIFVYHIHRVRCCMWVTLHAATSPPFFVSKRNYLFDLLNFMVFVKSEDVLQLRLRGMSENEDMGFIYV